jgi:competence protein ComEA
LGLLLLERAERRSPLGDSRVTPLGDLPVDLANDPPWRLRLLPGVGAVRAEALVRDRAANGAPTSIDDLDRVPGIGRRTIEALGAAGAFVGPPSDAPPRTTAPPATGAPARGPRESEANGPPAAEDDGGR